MSTSAPTTAFVVLATLVADLQAQPGLAGVQVLYGDTAHAERENLIISGDVTYSDETWAAIGARSRQEDYELPGYVQIRNPGASQQESHERAGQLISIVESSLRSLVQPGMGFSVALNAAFGTSKAQVTNVEYKPEKVLGWPADEGQRSQINFIIRITARI